MTRPPELSVCNGDPYSLFGWSAIVREDIQIGAPSGTKKGWGVSDRHQIPISHAVDHIHRKEGKGG